MRILIALIVILPVLSMPSFKPISDNVSELRLIWNLSRISLLKIQQVPVSMFLIKDGDGFILVDTGTPAMESDVMQAVASAIGSSDLKYILLTHGHIDHASSAPALLAAYPNSKLLSAEPEIPFLLGKSYGTLKDESDNMIFRFFASSMQETPSPLSQADIDTRFQNASTALDPTRYRVISTPGHTPGHLSVVVLSDRLWICGDSLMNLQSTSFTKPRLSGALSFSTPFKAEAALSLKAATAEAAALGVSWVAPSHNDGEIVPFSAVRGFVDSL
jgi:glyoxylase-like metal-dependent hydrolase (beta-lactamase superfamily II)